MRRRRRRRSSLMQPRRRSSPAEARLGIKLARGSGAGGTRGARATSMVAMGSQTRKHAVIYADATRLTLVAAGWGLFRKTKMVACKDNQGDHIHLLLAVCVSLLWRVIPIIPLGLCIPSEWVHYPSRISHQLCSDTNKSSVVVHR
ncbi:uncharacterized protein LOC119363755 [Triticum dicoccoides]|uniref:uncharacterized protein LOC119363755 n=1 Tax=Triticum dicoccoides TaxID=85692 RepID=UPI00188FA1AC|nr:uncharacterized protein LOC119363755 [Triticum dicoccoides]XP_037485020.1 uncharacterized protein LOC119363755 [Triticum dicoccoides]XP_044323891.1 uncharacterized protein LOC123045042 isoform X1 [Triticum aestivum]XP_044323892.1 uncharacterized protein LOC123045042 isoform X1 [Triticum aestivum]